MTPLYPTMEELAVIGCILQIGHKGYVDAAKHLSHDDFSNEISKEAWKILSGIPESDPLKLGFELRRAWEKKFGAAEPPEITHAAGNVPSASALMSYVTEVKDCSARRQFQKRLAANLSAFEDRKRPLAEILANVSADIERTSTQNPGDDADGKECAQALTDYLETRHAQGDRLSGLATGFERLDRMLDGMQPGEQTVVGARPSRGKTAFALNIVTEACFRKNVPTLFVSLEMNQVALCRRLLSQVSNIPLAEIKLGSYTQDKFDKFVSFNAQLANSQLRILDFSASGIDANRLAGLIKYKVKRHGIQLVIIDYLQKIRPTARHEKRTYEIASVSEALVHTARATRVAMVTLAQLNRDPDKGDAGRLPRLSDLADCGQIERDADTVILLHRPQTDQDPHGTHASLIIAKQRDGETGIVNVRFNGEYCRFESNCKITT